MRKQTKKVLSWVLAGAMTLGLAANVNFVPASADDAAEPAVKTVEATISNDQIGWDAAKTTIDKDGEYSLEVSSDKELKFSETNYVAVRIAALDGFFSKDDNGNSVSDKIKFSNVKVELDGTEVKDAAWTYGGDGDCRVQIWNNWGGYTPDVYKDLSYKTIKVTFSIEGIANYQDSVFATISHDVIGWDASEVGLLNGDGTYTIKIASEDEVDISNYLAVRIAAFDDFFTVNEETKQSESSVISFSDVKVKFDGKAVENPEWTYGGDGDCRIQLWNNWGGYTPDMYKDLKFKECEITFTINGANKAIEKLNSYVDQELWATKGIHAFIAYQMDGTWDYRNGYKPNDLGKQDTYDFIKAAGGEVKAKDVKVQDVLLTRDGEYTVSISGIDLTAATKYNLLSIATDLSAKTEDNPDGAYADVKLSVTSLKVDGAEVATNLDLVQKADELYYYYPLINKWNADDKGPLFDKTDAEELAVPENSIEITFKVTGLKAALNDLKNGTYKDPETGENVKNDSITQDDIDASDGVLPTPSVQPSEKPNVTPAPTNSPAPTKAPQAPKKGVKVTSGKVVYKVTKAATAKKAGTLSLVGLSKAGKKASSLSAPATAKINGYSYKVTSIGKNAFKGANAKTISLSKNIKSIPAGAFANCKKLSTLKVKAKLTKVAKKAFKGCKKTIKVKGASKKVTKANVKKLKKSGYKKFK